MRLLQRSTVEEKAIPDPKCTICNGTGIIQLFTSSSPCDCNSNNSMRLSTGLTSITYTYRGSNIHTEITQWGGVRIDDGPIPPDAKILHSLTRPIEHHQTFCDELRSSIESGRDYFQVILSGYLFIMDDEEIEKFINWFSQSTEKI